MLERLGRVLRRRDGSEPHFVSDYRALVARLLRTHGNEEAMSLAVGGNFHWIGQIEADLLRAWGLTPGMTLIDVGCGSGRTAHALAASGDAFAYHGTDVVPELLKHARSVTPASFRYTLVDDIRIPAADSTADFICAFSVFTHLMHEESYRYLMEARRVLKPGGRVMFSYLEFARPEHWAIFEGTVHQSATGTRPHLNVFIERTAIQVWADNLGLTVLTLEADRDKDVAISRDVTTDAGVPVRGRALLGQSVCVLEKPAQAPSP